MAGPKTLIITNGSVTVSTLKLNKAADAYLSWDDMLHEGPVPMCGSLGELSQKRSDFLQERYLLHLSGGTGEFADRNAAIGEHEKYDRIELWFEHDLYDQLQLIQVLDFFDGRNLPDGQLHLVQADDYLGVQPPEKIMRFKDRIAPITQQQLDVARLAWQAFRQTTPRAWAELLECDLSCLPWLKPSVLRMLEELPSSHSGLSRTEAELLSLIAEQQDTAARCVGQFLGEAYFQDEPAFVGDWTVFNLLQEFSEANTPLIAPLRGDWRSDDEAQCRQFKNSPARLTPMAHELLTGKADQITVNGIDRWWGGTHLTSDNCWRWDSAAQELVAP